MKDTGQVRVRKRLVVYLVAAGVFAAVVASLSLTYPRSPWWMGRLPAYLICPRLSETPWEVIWSSMFGSLVWLAPLPFYPRRGGGRWRWALYAAAVAVALGFAGWGIHRGPRYGFHYPRSGLPDGYRWEHVIGPDFYVFYGKPPEDKGGGVGVFVGGFPNQFLRDKRIRKPGEVASRNVSWVVVDTGKNGKPVWFRETHFKLRPWHQAWIHVWAFATSEAQMDALLVALKGLRFEKLTYASALSYPHADLGVAASRPSTGTRPAKTQPTTQPE